VSAERMIVNLIRRAQVLTAAGQDVKASEPLNLFLQSHYSFEKLKDDRVALSAFGKLDDHDIWGAIKFWCHHEDKILSTLSLMLIERRLFQIILSNDPIKKSTVEKIKNAVARKYKTLRSETTFLFSSGSVTNEAYAEGQKINILTKRGELLDIAQASDLPNIKAISKIVKKNYLCWPKDVSL
jgi:hypothetical protein